MTDPDTASTDPLVVLVAEAIATHSLERGHRGMFSICSCGKRFPLADWPAFNAHQAQAVVAAVRAHQNTTGQQAVIQALRDAADDWEQANRFVAQLKRFIAEHRHLGDIPASIWLRARADTLNTIQDPA